MDDVMDAIDSLGGYEARAVLRHIVTRQEDSDTRAVAMGLVADAIESVTAPLVAG